MSSKNSTIGSAEKAHDLSKLKEPLRSHGGLHEREVPFISNKKINLTIFASGSEVNLAIETCHKLAKDKIYSKVISVPCQDIFDLQSKAYKKKILNEAKFKISIEAASTDCWKKYIGTEGLAFGIDTFGKSAPYKEIYKYFGLTVQNISQKTKKLIKS